MKRTRTRILLIDGANVRIAGQLNADRDKGDRPTGIADESDHKVLRGIMSNGLGPRRFWQGLFATIVSITPAFSALAQDDAAAVRGAEVTEEWCRLCHLRPGDRPDPDMAPPFEELVTRPGRDRDFYLSFMAEDHFPMTTFRLYDDEKLDVIEYLLSLQNR